MEVTRIKDKRNIRIMIIGLACIAVVVTSLCFVTVNMVKNTVSAETDRYLDEISHHLAALANHKVASTYQMLNASAAVYQQLESGEARTQYLQTISESFDFQRISVIGMDGTIVSMDGKGLNVLEEPYVQSALQGKSAISERVPSPVDGTEVLIFTVPLIENHSVAGALAASIPQESMTDFLAIESFGGEGYCAVIDREGHFVIKSTNKNVHSTGDNFFGLLEQNGTLQSNTSLDQIKRNFEDDLAGNFSYSLEDGMKKTLNYTPLDVDGWYLLSIVPEDVNRKTANRFIRFSAIINIVIVVLFLSLILLIVFLQRKNQKRLAEFAFTDPVTGGCNRMAFEMNAERLIGKSAAGSFILVSLDIDKFKLINDLYGSNRGNDTLRYVYQTIQKLLQPDELLARIAGDTFSLLLHRTDQDKIRRRLYDMAEKINRFNDALERKYYLTFSMGVYEIEDPGLEMIAIEDRATVARKNSARALDNRMVSCMFYSEFERIRMIHEKEIGNRMQEALENHEFIFFLQPKYDLKSNEICGAEALVRWNDPKRGLLSPSEFVPIFEKNGFITRMDLFVFEQVCALLQKWIENGITPVPISVNLSRVHLRTPDFLEEYQAIWEKYRVPARLIEIELTETLVFENLDAFGRIIDQIHNIGFHCSLDDFGSGYSSLNTLKDIPADVLKLDRAFFSDPAMDNKRGNEVVESVIELAHKLQMQTVAEGIETLPQVEFLRQTKCDVVQGFIFSKPIPVSEFELLAFDQKLSGAAIL